jgi:quercetin dioxygenase-like cupin family protein
MRTLQLDHLDHHQPGEKIFSLKLLPAIHAHAQAMISGWVGLFVMGFAYQSFPRFKNTTLWRPELANLSFYPTPADISRPNPIPHQKTLKWAILLAKQIEIFSVAMKAGARLLRHRTAGRISIQACRGSIRIVFNGDFETEITEMTAGDLFMLDREVAHDVEAITDCAFLLTIAWPSLDPVLTGEILARAPVHRYNSEFVAIEDDRFLVTGPA